MQSNLITEAILLFSDYNRIIRHNLGMLEYNNDKDRFIRVYISNIYYKIVQKVQ